MAAEEGDDLAPVPPGLISEHLPDFVERWEVDQQSQDFLSALPVEVQEEVIATFDPPQGTRNMSAKLMAFARRLAAELGFKDQTPRPGGGGGGGGRGRDRDPAPPVSSRGPSDGGDGGGAAWSRGLEREVADFVVHWGLDQDCEQILLSMDPIFVEEVLADFNPEANTRNVSAKLRAFIRARQKGAPPQAGGGGGGGSSARAPRRDPIEEFADSWSLDESAVQMLRRLPQDVCSDVLASFDPPPGTQNISAKLSAYAKRRADKLGLPFVASGPPPPAVFVPSIIGTPRGAAAPARAPLATSRSTVAGRPPLARPAPHLDAIARFIERWGCDAACEASLRQLQPEQQAGVIRDFDPPPGTQNMSRKLMSFLRSFSRGKAAPPRMDPTEEFAAHWRLDQEALQALRSLPQDLQEGVMTEFNPPAGTMNVSRKLMAFIRMSQKRGSGPGGGPPSLDSALAEFSRRWRLDEDALNLLNSLPDDVLIGVIEDFQPPASTYNPSGRLHSFVRARLRELEESGAGAEGPAAPWRNAGPGDEPPPPIGAVGGGGGGGGRDDVDDFVDRWGLDRSSEDMLRGLPPDLLDRVLSSFEPQQNTRNFNAKLAIWVRSLQKEAGGGAPKRQRLF